MRSLIQDIRYALRILARTPGLSVIAILTLALTIGVNAGMFSLMDSSLGIVDRFDAPDELVVLSTSHDRGHFDALRGRDYLAIRDQSGTLAEIGVHGVARFYLGHDESTERVLGLTASANLLPMLGLDVASGRLPLPEECEPGADPVVVLTDRLWHSRFDGDPDVLGRSVRLNDTHHTVIGILPPRFDLQRPWYAIDVLVPMVVDPVVDLQESWVFAMARLRPGIAPAEAQTELCAIVAQRADADPGGYTGLRIDLQTFREFHVPLDERLLFLALQVAVGLVLLIACANLANLLLARTTMRVREYAVRVALGASRWRIIRQVLVECALLAMIGGCLGLLVGVWASRLYLVHDERAPMLPEEVGLDLAVVTYALVVSGAATLALGIAPALVASKVSLTETLKEGTVTTQGGRFGHRLRSGLVIAQLAIAIPFLVCCGLLLRHVSGLRHMDFGYDIGNVVSVEVDLPGYSYPTDAQRIAFFNEAIRRIEALPGIESASSGLDIPVYGFGRGHTRIRLEDGRGLDPDDRIIWSWRTVAPGFFETLGAPLIAGRWLTDRDRPDTQDVAVINRRLADRYWPDEDPIGRRIARLADGGTDEVRWFTIVGIVGDTGRGYYGEPPSPTAYVPYIQEPGSHQMIVARTRGDPIEAIPPMRAILRALDTDVAVGEFATAEQIAYRACQDDRLSATFFTGLAILALGLSVMGLYGVMSHAVAQRTHEIGIRVAIGADRGTITRWVLARCLRLVLVGLVIGVVLSVPLGLGLQNALFEVSGVDPLTFIGVATVLIAAGLLAGYLPARRATRVDPVVALRCE